MKYTKTSSTSYYVGLPDVPELDDTNLTPEQKELLALAVAAGVYIPVVTDPPAPKLNKLSRNSDLIKD